MDSARRPRLLDLFCGAGGAARGSATRRELDGRTWDEYPR